MLISMFVVKDSGRSGSFGHRDLSEEGMTHVNTQSLLQYL
jgi:hypothetical protein